LCLSHGAKQVDNQIKSIKSSDALAKEGIFVINPLWHAHRRATGTREKVGGIRLEWMNNHLVQRHYKFIHLFKPDPLTLAAAEKCKSEAALSSST
jgi:hypothetical protein